MGELSRRERLVAAAFYGATALATIGWWALLLLVPASREWFFGRRFAGTLPIAFLLPDLVSALLLAIWLVPTVLKSSPWARFGAALHAGGQGYAFLIAVSLAAQDPTAYPGVVCMMFSSGAALAFAMRLNQAPVLWGPFRFAPAPPRDGRGHWVEALKQTAAMWLVFLLLIPAGMAAAEAALGWNSQWWSHPMRMAFAVPVFVTCGSVGLWSGWVMTHLGGGTPLPSDHPAQLVVAGPYRVIRNPMALAGIAQGVAVGVGIGSPLVACYALTGAVAWEVLTRPLEEAHLEKVFGAPYAAYRQAVRCWIPSPPYRQSQDKLGP